MNNEDNGGLGNEAVMSILEKNYSGIFTFISAEGENEEYQTVLKIKLS